MSFEERLRQILNDGKSAIEAARDADTWSPQSWILDIQQALKVAGAVLKDELQGSAAGVTGDDTSRTLTVRVDPMLLWDLRHNTLGVRMYTLTFKADHAAKKTTAEARFSHRGPAVFSETIDHTASALAMVERCIGEFFAEINADLEDLRPQAD